LSASINTQDSAPHSKTSQHTTTYCNALQRSATHCTTLQHAATRCNTPQQQHTSENGAKWQSFSGSAGSASGGSRGAVAFLKSMLYSDLIQAM